MIYLGGFIWVYWCLLLTWLTGWQSRVFAVLAVLGMGGIAVLRGDVGTDTATYESIVSNIRHMSWYGYTWYEVKFGMEPGFVTLAGVLTMVTESDQIAVRLLALIFTGALLLFVQRADRDELFLLMAFILPAFFYMYTMNGLRIGIASLFLLFSVQIIRRQKELESTVTAFLSLLFHYSTLIANFILWAARRRWLNLSSLLFWVLMVTCIIAAILMIREYFLHKMELFSDLESPSSISGLPNVLVMAVLLIALNFSNLPLRERLKLMIIGGVMALAFFGLARYSRAGLRLLNVLAFVFPLAILSAYGQNRLPMDNAVRGGVFAGGLLSATAFYLRILFDPGGGLTPWLPYEMLTGWF